MDITKLVDKICITEDITLVTINNLPYESNVIYNIMELLAQNNINIDMVSMPASIGNNGIFSFTIYDEDAPKVVSLLGDKNSEYYKKGITFSFIGKMAKVSFYSKDMPENYGVMRSILSLFNDMFAKPKMITTSDKYVLVAFDGHYVMDIIKKCKDIFNVDVIL